MKKVLLFLFCAVLSLVSCSKSEPQIEEVKSGSAYIKFVKDTKISSGQTVEEEFKMSFVMIWKADDRDFEYKGLGDKVYAIDKKTNEAVKANYAFSDLKSKSVELPSGKYFIAVLTDLNSSPKLAYSYTTFTITSGKVTEVKKNVSNMNSNQYSVW